MFLTRLFPVRALCALAFLSAAAAVVTPAAAQTVSIDDEAGSAFKGAKRVIVYQFGVEYYTQAMGIGQSGGNKATQKSTLEGVSDAAMQAMVDKLYGDTVARLKDAGFDVLERQLLTDDAQYKELEAAYGKPSPYVVHDSQGLNDGEHLSKLFAPTGMPAFYASGGSSGGNIRANMTDRFNSQNQGTAGKEGEIAKRLDVTLLKFSFLANYGIIKASKNGLLANFANLAGRVSLETAPVLVPHDTQVQFVNASGARVFGNIRRPGQSGAFYLDKPLQGENIFTTADTTTAESKTSDNVGNAIMGVFGVKASSKSQVIQVNANDQSYTEAYTKLLNQADEALIKALVAAR